MWKKIELHNHTCESDGKMTPKDLAAYFWECGILNFSLTDHNTISGWAKLKKSCPQYGLNYIQGLELTSYYGHLLAQNISDYIPWDDINEDNADPLFIRIHEKGGIAGPAHPFSIPSPFSNGMNWSMKIHDYSLIDFIEVINNAHPMFPDNQKAIQWWENLVLKGYNISPVSGMDLHVKENMDNFFTTYIKVNNKCDTLSEQLNHAIHHCETLVTKGPLFDWNYSNELTITHTLKAEDTKRILKIHTQSSTFSTSFNAQSISFPVPGNMPSVIYLFQKEPEWENLLAIACSIPSIQ